MDFLAQTPWWHYLLALPAAVLTVNGLPHFLHGIAGQAFPTPFTGGPGSRDSALRNVFWGAGNIVAGGLLLGLLSASFGNPLLVTELVVAATGFGGLMAQLFSHPERFGRAGQ